MLKASDTRRGSIHPTHKTLRIALKPSGFVGARRQQSAGFGPPFSECKRSPWARGDFGSRRALALARAAVHCKDEAKVETKVQTKAEASPPGLRCTALMHGQPGSMPFTLMTAAAAGEDRNRISARATSGSLALAVTP